MKMELMFPSKYLRAADLEGDLTVTIADVVMDELVMRGGRREKKPVLHLDGEDKMLVLNKPNGEAIAAAYGRESDNWRGKELVLFPAEVVFGRERVRAIRVRAPGAAVADNGTEQGGAPQDQAPPGFFTAAAKKLWWPLTAAFDAEELASAGDAVKRAVANKEIRTNEVAALKAEYRAARTRFTNIDRQWHTG